jgi:uncharacterized protein (DUF1810 family)
LLARYLESVEPINAIMTSANPKANPHQNFSSLFRSANSLARYVMARILEFIRLQNALGSPDDLKFRSCLTLFAQAASDPDQGLFEQALHQFYDGPDPRTLQLLGAMPQS